MTPKFNGSSDTKCSKIDGENQKVQRPAYPPRLPVKLIRGGKTTFIQKVHSSWQHKNVTILLKYQTKRLLPYYIHCRKVFSKQGKYGFLSSSLINRKCLVGCLLFSYFSKCNENTILWGFVVRPTMHL